MSIRMLSALYAIFAGVAIFGVWFLLIATGKVPDVVTKPTEIRFHLLAEGMTAIILITGGVGLLWRKKNAFQMHTISLGMLLYTTLVTAGVYAQQGLATLELLFLGLTVLTIYFIGSLIFSSDAYRFSRETRHE